MLISNDKVILFLVKYKATEYLELLCIIKQSANTNNVKQSSIPVSLKMECFSFLF